MTTPSQIIYVNDDTTMGGPTIATTIKAADQSVISSTTLVGESALMPIVGAFQTWLLTYRLYTTSAVAAGFRVSFTYPAGATGFADWSEVDQSGSGGWITLAGLTGLGATGLAFTSASTNNVFEFTIEITTTGTAGAVQMQFAQGTSTASNTTVGAGSYVQAVRVA